jgi:uncharacterized membrane protein
MELKEIDNQDIEDTILKIEKSFEFNFNKNELSDVKTFGDLCDAVLAKIKLENIDDCTSQQAFFKFRKAIVKFSEFEEKNIHPKVKLSEIFPKKHRINRIKEIEKELNVELNLLRPPEFVSGSLIILLIVSLIGFLFAWKLALIGLITSVLGLYIAFKVGDNFNLQTVGQVSDKMMRENYIKSRRNLTTVNRKEIEKVISDLFVNNLYLDESELTRASELY